MDDDYSDMTVEELRKAMEILIEQSDVLGELGRTNETTYEKVEQAFNQKLAKSEYDRIKDAKYIKRVFVQNDDSVSWATLYKINTVTLDSNGMCIVDYSETINLNDSRIRIYANSGSTCNNSGPDYIVITQKEYDSVKQSALSIEKLMQSTLNNLK